jgi:hypothetical protein
LGIDVKNSLRLASIILFSGGLFSGVTASSLDPAQLNPALTGEAIRSNLASARVDFGFDLPGARALTRDAKAKAVQLAKNFEPSIAEEITSSFALAETALRTNDERGFTRATAHAWTAREFSDLKRFRQCPRMVEPA